jgi:hypothetical protein
MPACPPSAAGSRSRPGRPVHSAALRAGLLCLVLLPSAALAAAPVAPRWDHSETIDSADGYAQLSWGIPLEDQHPESETEWIYHLQEGRRPVFNETDVQYMGTQHSSFVSGLEDGTYYYRVRARAPDQEQWGPWSTVVHVEVRHHDRRFALGLMALGGMVFLATAGFLLRHRNDPVPAGAPGGPNG